MIEIINRLIEDSQFEGIDFGFEKPVAVYYLTIDGERTGIDFVDPTLYISEDLRKKEEDKLYSRVCNELHSLEII